MRATAQFTIYDIPRPHARPPIAVNDPELARTGYADYAGQNALLPITGTSVGQQITVHVTQNGFTTSNCVTCRYLTLGQSG